MAIRSDQARESRAKGSCDQPDRCVFALIQPKRDKCEIVQITN